MGRKDMSIRRAAIAALAALGIVVAGSAAHASDVDVAVVDVTTPTNAVTLAPGASSQITINMSISGNQVGVATFEVFRDWTLSAGTFRGSNPQEFTVAPRAGGEPATTFSTTGSVSVAAGQANGTFTLAVGAFDITNTNSSGGKLQAGRSSSYAVTVQAPANTPPIVLVTDVTDGATYTYGAVPAAACSVTDAEDSDEAATPSITGPASGIGTFVATCTYKDHGGLERSASASYTVVKAPSSVTVTCPASEQYTGEALENCEATVSGVELSAGLPVTYASNINVGTATASAEFAGDDHHLGNTGSATFAITAAESEITVSCPSSVTYDGSAIEPCTARATGIGGLDEDLDVTYEANVNAGTATASASFPGDANHAGSDGSATFEISKAEAVVSIDCGTGPYTYSAGAQEPCSASVTGTGGLSQSLTVTYTNNTDAGTATAAAAFTGDENHEGASSSATFEIARANVTVTVTCDDGPFVFDGDVHEPCAATVQGPGLDTTVDVDYANNVNAGTASASSSFPTGGNYVGGSDTQTFEIEKADSVTHITCPAEVAWDGMAQDPCTATATGPGGLDQVLTVTYSGNSEVGTATASAVYAGGANHNGSDFATTFKIVKAQSTTTVTCAPTGLVYNGAPQTPCAARVEGAGGLDLPVAVSYADNVNAGTATATAAWPGDDHHLPSTDSATFAITRAASTTTVSCTSAYFTGSAITPCTATVTGVGGLAQSLSVSYTNNTAPGTATATASFPGGSNHFGSSGTKTFQIMTWTLGGFYQPVDMGGVLNTVKGGSTVPLKFEVSRGTEELTATSAIKSFTQAKIACDGSTPTDEIEVTSTGGTSLRYDSTGGQFIQNWQTPKASGSCYRATMTTQDGSVISANFKLK